MTIQSDSEVRGVPVNPALRESMPANISEYVHRLDSVPDLFFSGFSKVSKSERLK
jgi:hypothetical protein